MPAPRCTAEAVHRLRRCAVATSIIELCKLRDSALSMNHDSALPMNHEHQMPSAPQAPKMNRGERAPRRTLQPPRSQPYIRHCRRRLIVRRPPSELQRRNRRHQAGCSTHRPWTPATAHACCACAMPILHLSRFAQAHSGCPYYSCFHDDHSRNGHTRSRACVHARTSSAAFCSFAASAAF